jgi:hypothetical protein
MSPWNWRFFGEEAIMRGLRFPFAVPQARISLPLFDCPTTTIATGLSFIFYLIKGRNVCGVIIDVDPADRSATLAGCLGVFPEQPIFISVE